MFSSALLLSYDNIPQVHKFIDFENVKDIRQLLLTEYYLFLFVVW